MVGVRRVNDSVDWATLGVSRADVVVARYCPSMDAVMVPDPRCCNATKLLSTVDVPARSDNTPAGTTLLLVLRNNPLPETTSTRMVEAFDPDAAIFVVGATTAVVAGCTFVVDTLVAADVVSVDVDPMFVDVLTVVSVVRNILVVVDDCSFPNVGRRMLNEVVDCVVRRPMVVLEVAPRPPPVSYRVASVSAYSALEVVLTGERVNNAVVLSWAPEPSGDVRVMIDVVEPMEGSLNFALGSVAELRLPLVEVVLTS